MWFFCVFLQSCAICHSCIAQQKHLNAKEKTNNRWFIYTRRTNKVCQSVWQTWQRLSRLIIKGTIHHWHAGDARWSVFSTIKWLCEEINPSGMRPLHFFFFLLLLSKSLFLHTCIRTFHWLKTPPSVRRHSHNKWLTEISSTQLFRLITPHEDLQVTFSNHGSTVTQKVVQQFKIHPSQKGEIEDQHGRYTLWGIWIQISNISRHKTQDIGSTFPY